MATVLDPNSYYVPLHMLKCLFMRGSAPDSKMRWSLSHLVLKLRAGNDTRAAAVDCGYEDMPRVLLAMVTFSKVLQGMEDNFSQKLYSVQSCTSQ